MAPHLVRAQSVYKDGRIRSFHHARTHTYAYAQTHTLNVVSKRGVKGIS